MWCPLPLLCDLPLKREHMKGSDVGVFALCALLGCWCTQFIEWSMPPISTISTTRGWLALSLECIDLFSFAVRKGCRAHCWEEAIFWIHVTPEPGRGSAVNPEPAKCPSTFFLHVWQTKQSAVGLQVRQRAELKSLACRGGRRSKVGGWKGDTRIRFQEPRAGSQEENDVKRKNHKW